MRGRFHHKHVDFGLLKKWISTCEKGHAKCYSQSVGWRKRRQIFGNVHELKVISIPCKGGLLLHLMLADMQR